MARQIILMDKNRIERALKRIAIQIYERFEGKELILVGLNERGFATSKQLHSHLSKLVDKSLLALHNYNIHDASDNGVLPNCAEKNVLIIDDVIFSGKTMFDAISAVCATGNPEKIEIVTLVDRGHRRYPINSDLKGISVPTKFGEHIEVMLQGNAPDQVILFKN